MLLFRKTIFHYFLFKGCTQYRDMEIDGQTVEITDTHCVLQFIKVLHYSLCVSDVGAV